MADPVARKLPLRHPAEIPTFILMVVLNFVIWAFSSTSWSRLP
jgi:hypothetical protein